MRDEGSSRMPLVTGGKGWDTGRKAALQGRFGLQLWGSVRSPSSATARREDDGAWGRERG